MTMTTGTIREPLESEILIENEDATRSDEKSKLVKDDKENTDNKNTTSLEHSRLLFGSCNSQYREQPMWSAIVERNASAFVWCGDAVYADSKASGRDVMATPDVLAQSYERQLNHPDYAKLLSQNHKMTIVGTWDDHDFGLNNGDREYPYRKESAVLFVDFLEKSANKSWNLMAQRAKQGKGVYGVVVFDFTREDPLLSDEEAGIDVDLLRSTNTTTEKTNLSNQSAAIFLLDIRYHKSPWRRGFQYVVGGDYQGDFLGEEQWQWLEQSLARSTAQVNIIVNGLLVHADRFFDGRTVEEWSRFPMAQHRLYQALLQDNVRAPIIVSGDVHMAEFAQRDCRKRHSTTDGPVDQYRSLIEVTTSGMTHSWGTQQCPRLQKTGDSPPPLQCSSYFHSVLKWAMHLAHWSTTWKELMIFNPRVGTEGMKHGLQYSLDQNFAEFEFDWENDDDSKSSSSQVRVRILGADGRARLTGAWTLDDLSQMVNHNNGQHHDQQQQQHAFLTSVDFERRYETLYRGNGGDGISEDDWICLPHQGVISTFTKALAPSLAFTFITLSILGPPLILPISFFIYWTRRWFRGHPFPRKVKCL